MTAQRLASFVSKCLIFGPTVFSIATKCDGSGPFPENAGMPEIKFCASNVQIERELHGITYFNSSGNQFLLTLECKAFYPIQWHSEESTSKLVDAILWLNKRIYPDTSPAISHGAQLFTSIIMVKIDPDLIKRSEAATYSCKSLENPCRNNAVYVYRHFWDSPQIIFVSTDETSFLRRQYNNCPWNSSKEDDKTPQLKPYPILSQEKYANNKSCDDVLHMDLIDELSEDQEFIPENRSMIIRCRAQKYYLSQGSFFAYRLRDATEIISLKNVTEMDSGDYYEILANLPIDENHETIQQVYCSVPLWNSYSWCNATIILKTRKKIELTTKRDLSVNYSSTDTGGNSVLLLNSSSFNPEYNYSAIDNIYNITIGSNDSNENFTGYKNESVIENFSDKNIQNKSETNDSATYAVPIIMIIAVVSASFLICLLIIIIMYPVLKRKRESNRIKEYLPELRVLMAPKNLLSEHSECVEIVKDSLTIDENFVLGQGTFGVVYKAVLRTQSIAYDVAVKASKNDSEFAIKSLKKELKVIAKMKMHENIVHLIGAVTEDLQNGNLYIVLEYCSNGNLRDYLRKHKTSFKNIVLENPLEIQENFQMDYVLSTTDLISWSLDISKGMQCLSSHNIVHGDLACRNVLLSSARVAKLTDFGLAKQLEEYYYINKKEVPMPWKWMAYESLQYQKFSAKTDIWSYGITMWEIFSLGDSPWVGCQWGEEFLETLAAGVRPKKPDYASDEIYQIMKQCWRTETVLRPNFNESAKQLEIILKKIANANKENNVTEERDSCQEHYSEYDHYLIPIKPK